MYIKSQVSVQAWFKLVARKASDDSIARETVWFPNIVVDAGLDRMSVGEWCQYCAVGSGNSTPIPTNTTLDSILAIHNTLPSTSAKWVIGGDTGPTYLSKVQRFRFNEGVAAGNLTEVSMGWGTSTTNLANFRCWNRALILDAEGKPTTLTVLSDEYLDVTTEIRLYPTLNVAGAFELVNKTGEVISSHTFRGTPHIPNSGTFGGTGKVGIGNLESYTGSLPDQLSGVPSGRIGIAASSSVTSEYPNPRTCRAIAVLGLSTGNGDNKSFKQLFSLMSGSQYWGYMFEVDPPVPKDGTQLLTIVSDLTWGRYTGG